MGRTGSGVVEGTNFLLGVTSEDKIILNTRCANKMPHWSEFTPSGRCSVECGGGVIDDVRVCMDGKPGGYGCPGPDRRTRICNSEPCKKDPKWGPYTSGPCSVSCGGGQMKKTRVCIDGQPGDAGCKGPVSKIRSCNTKPCGKKN